jgi:hypothetical protein
VFLGTGVSFDRLSRRNKPAFDAREGHRRTDLGQPYSEQKANTESSPSSGADGKQAGPAATRLIWWVSP